MKKIWMIRILVGLVLLGLGWSVNELHGPTPGLGSGVCALDESTLRYEVRTIDPLGYDGNPEVLVKVGNYTPITGTVKGITRREDGKWVVVFHRPGSPHRGVLTLESCP